MGNWLTSIIYDTYIYKILNTFVNADFLEKIHHRLTLLFPAFNCLALQLAAICGNIPFRAVSYVHCIQTNSCRWWVGRMPHANQTFLCGSFFFGSAAEADVLIFLGMQSERDQESFLLTSIQTAKRFRTCTCRQALASIDRSGVCKRVLTNDLARCWREKKQSQSQAEDDHCL